MTSITTDNANLMALHFAAMLATPTVMVEVHEERSGVFLEVEDTETGDYLWQPLFSMEHARSIFRSCRDAMTDVDGDEWFAAIDRSLLKHDDNPFI